MTRKVLYALVLILIVSFSVAGYDFYVIEQQSVKIRVQTVLIENQRIAIGEMNATIIELRSENAKLVITVKQKEEAIREFKDQLSELQIQVYDLTRALENSSNWPDLDTLKTFLARDQTDTNRYVKGSYECEEFALDLQKAAYKKGYFLSVQYVTVGLLEQYGWEYQAPRAMTHVCNLAFAIKENAFYIVEPQTDEIAFLSYAD